MSWPYNTLISHNGAKTVVCLKCGSLCGAHKLRLCRHCFMQLPVAERKRLGLGGKKKFTNSNLQCGTPLLSPRPRGERGAD